jgi:hypothetical protein
MEAIEVSKESEYLYLERFKKICQEVDIDPQKILSKPPAVLGPLLRQWMIGEINDVEMMRSLRNLAIFNPSIKA